MVNATFEQFVEGGKEGALAVMKVDGAAVYMEADDLRRLAIENPSNAECGIWQQKAQQMVDGLYLEGEVGVFEAEERSSRSPMLPLVVPTELNMASSEDVSFVALTPGGTKGVTAEIKVGKHTKNYEEEGLRDLVRMFPRHHELPLWQQIADQMAADTHIKDFTYVAPMGAGQTPGKGVE